METTVYECLNRYVINNNRYEIQYYANASECITGRSLLRVDKGCYCMI